MKIQGIVELDTDFLPGKMFCPDMALHEILEPLLDQLRADLTAKFHEVIAVELGRKVVVKEL